MNKISFQSNIRKTSVLLKRSFVYYFFHPKKASQQYKEEYHISFGYSNKMFTITFLRTQICAFIRIYGSCKNANLLVYGFKMLIVSMIFKIIELEIKGS